VAGVVAAAWAAPLSLRQPGRDSRAGGVAMAPARPAIASLHAVHSGKIGDYVAWLYAGLIVLATVLVVQLR